MDKRCKFSILMIFRHHLTCSYANFLTSMPSMFFSNSCHFLKSAI